jgi:hypothetical protein
MSQSQATLILAHQARRPALELLVLGKRSQQLVSSAFRHFAAVEHRVDARGEIRNRELLERREGEARRAHDAPTPDEPVVQAKRLEVRTWALHRALLAHRFSQLSHRLINCSRLRQFSSSGIFRPPVFYIQGEPHRSVIADAG